MKEVTEINKIDERFEEFFSKPYTYSQVWAHEDPPEELLSKEDLDFIIIKNKKENIMKKLEQLKTPKTAEFNSFITPVISYINENYGEYKEELNEELITEILKEISEKEGILCYIDIDNRLCIHHNFIWERWWDSNCSKLSYFTEPLTVLDIADSYYEEYGDRNKIPFEERFHVVPYDGPTKNNNKLEDIYYIKDIKDLISFISNEQEQIAKEYLKTELERIDKNNSYIEKAKKYNLKNVDKYKIDKLDKIVELQSKKLNEFTPIELLELLKNIYGQCISN